MPFINEIIIGIIAAVILIILSELYFKRLQNKSPDLNEFERSLLEARVGVGKFIP